MNATQHTHSADENKANIIAPQVGTTKSSVNKSTLSKAFFSKVVAAALIFIGVSAALPAAADSNDEGFGLVAGLVLGAVLADSLDHDAHAVRVHRGHDHRYSHRYDRRYDRYYDRRYNRYDRYDRRAAKRYRKLQRRQDRALARAYRKGYKDSRRGRENAFRGDYRNLRDGHRGHRHDRRGLCLI